MPEGFREVRAPGGRRWIVREGVAFDFRTQRWDSWLAGEEGRILTQEGGRSPCRCLDLPGIGKVVVRRYLHGGALAWIARDLFPGLTRAVRELEASERIRRRGVATPEILAVYSRESLPGLRRTCLVSRLVPDGVNLRQWVRQGPAGPAARRGMARAVALEVAALHGAGCYHKDLNLSNLLLASGQIWILDLDGAILKSGLGIRERGKNLLRLYRSLCREFGARKPLSAREGIAFLRHYAGADECLFRGLLAWIQSRRRGLALRLALSGARVTRRGQASPGSP